MALLAAGGALPAAAQTTFPSRPIKLIIPHAPGGNSDTFGRILALKMSERINQQVVVENKPGAGGTLASAQVAKSPPDGYTLVVADNGTHAIAPTLYGAKLTYDVFKDFTPITLAAKFPTVIMIHPSVPATPSARTLPASMCGSAVLTLTAVSCTSPASSACTAGAPPL